MHNDLFALVLMSCDKDALSTPPPPPQWSWSHYIIAVRGGGGRGGGGGGGGHAPPEHEFVKSESLKWLEMH